VVSGRQREDSASSSREERLGEHDFYLDVEVVVELRLDSGSRMDTVEILETRSRFRERVGRSVGLVNCEKFLYYGRDLESRQ
jgi:hypothetical protein